MGTFGWRRDGVAGCRSFESEVAGASAGVPTKNSEIDFSDVFGGPPRRYSIHRRLYASIEAAAESSSSIESRGSPQPNDEKPVFGHEGLRRSSSSSSSRCRCHMSEDFFDDIFRGDEPAPDSRVMSRTHPWLPGAEPSCSSPVPAQSSLSAKLPRGTELPQFSSGFHPGSSEVFVNGCQFHFSIYKWASKGIPLDMQPGGGGWLRLKETEKTETWPSSNGWVEGHHGINKLSAASHQVEIERPGTGDVNVTEQSQSIEEAFLSTLESENMKGAFGDDEPTLKVRRKENTSCPAPKSMAGIENEASVNNLEGEKSISNCEADDFSMQGSSTTSEEHVGGSRLKGNVRKFVEIFNQETSSPKVHINPQSQSSGCKSREMDPGAKKQTSCGTKRMEEEKRIPAMNGKKMDEKFKQEEKPCPNVKSNLHELSDTNIQKNGSASVSDGLESTFNMEESLQENLVVSDARIQKWLSGKEGNIRSLLSTLQFVLWASSGWKPVPLVDIIETAAVKRAYQKALLCVHPDKLQQKGAGSQRKYLAARVFDILQEAWGQFNSMSTMPA